MNERLYNLARHSAAAADALGHYQSPDGSFENVHPALSEQFHELSELYLSLCRQTGGAALLSAELFKEDSDLWAANGLSTRPNFKSTHRNWQLPERGDGYTPFLAPLRVPNSFRGNDFMLTFALIRPHEYIYEDSEAVVNQATSAITDPKDVRVLDASVRNAVYTKGDGSVLFSELLCSDNRSAAQTFGGFIINDFRKRYQTMTQGSNVLYDPRTQNILQEEPLISFEDERAVWLRVHDAYHDTGARPHANNLQMKMKFSPAVLDELKADSGAYMALAEQNEVWHRAVLRQAMDKMFRFPYSAYGYRSVDAGVGELILRKSLRLRAIKQTKIGVRLDPARLHEVMYQIHNDALAVEEEKDADDYYRFCNEYLNTNSVKSGSHRVQLVGLPE